MGTFGSRLSGMVCVTVQRSANRTPVAGTLTFPNLRIKLGNQGIRNWRGLRLLDCLSGQISGSLLRYMPTTSMTFSIIWMS